MKYQHKILFIALVGLGLVGVGFVFHQSPPSTPTTTDIPKPHAEAGVLRFAQNAPQLSQLKIDPVVLAAVPLTESLAGHIAYNEDTTARLFAPIAGRVVQIKAQLGDRVQAGNVLLTLDAPDLGQALSDQAKAVADAEHKQAEYQRTKMLFEAEVIAKRDFENAEADWRQAKAESERARLRLNNLTHGAATEGEHFALRSPINGVIAERHVTPDFEARPDATEPLFVVTDLSRLTVLVDLPEKDIGRIAVGQPVQIDVTAYPDRLFHGVVERIAPVVDATTRRVQVRASVNNSDGALKPEMYARVTLIADEQNKAPRIPIAALLIEGVKNYVFVAGPGDTFEKREVTLAGQTRDYAYVASGLSADSKVVTDGALLLNAELIGGEQ